MDSGSRTLLIFSLKTSTSVSYVADMDRVKTNAPTLSAATNARAATSKAPAWPAMDTAARKSTCAPPTMADARTLASIQSVIRLSRFSSAR